MKDTDLKQIHKAIAELTTIVSEIKNELSIVNKKVDDTNQLSLDLPELELL